MPVSHIGARASLPAVPWLVPAIVSVRSASPDGPLRIEGATRDWQARRGRDASGPGWNPLQTIFRHRPCLAQREEEAFPPGSATHQEGT